MFENNKKLTVKIYNDPTFKVEWSDLLITLANYLVSIIGIIDRIYNEWLVKIRFNNEIITLNRN